MTTLPQTLAMIALLASTTLASAAPSADFNNDGVVDTIDLLEMASNINQSCVGECPWDLNTNGNVDGADLLLLMNQWGEVNDDQSDNDSNDSQDDQSSQDLSWQNEAPKLYNAIFYEDLSRVPENRRNLAILLDQGAQSKEWSTANNVSTIPFAYWGGVDWNANGQLTDSDKEKFSNWMNENFAADYDGPICLDMEGQWWSMFDTSNQNVMDVVIDFYIEGLEYAQSLRPNAKIGYWGLPKKSHTKVTSTTADVSRLLQASTALFPDLYDMNPAICQRNRSTHIEKAMEMVNGQIPVYVQTSPRYKASNGQYSEFHSIEEFMIDQVEPALNAVWTNEDGKEHRVQGVALWDAYEYVFRYTDNWSMLDNETRRVMFNELDEHHVDLFNSMKVSVDIAQEEAETRLASSQEEEAAAHSVAVAAAETQAASELIEARTTQRARLINRINSAKTRVVSKTHSYKKRAKSYRNKRKKFSKAKRSFAKAKRKYKRGSKQYKLAIAAYKRAQKSLKTASKSYRKQRNSYRAARASRNTLQNQWRANSTRWNAMASAASSLTSN